jgi:acetyl esterase
MPLDQANAAFLAQVAKARTVPLTEMSPVQVREGMARMRVIFGEGPEMAVARDAVLSTGACARLFVPAGDVRALVVYLHGGGWVTGSIEDFDAHARDLAAASQSAVLLVGYRLAPEHPFPAALDDAYAALRWCADHGQEIAGKALPLVLAGDSAGGNLVAVIARWARDRGGPEVALQIMVYPATDADFDRPSYLDPDCQQLLERDTMRWYWSHYLPDSAARLSPDASPLHAADLSRLPPALVITAECDPLRDEGEAYAQALQAAGVAVEHERFAGQMHGFFTMVNVLPARARGISRVAAYITAHTTS